MNKAIFLCLGLVFQSIFLVAQVLPVCHPGATPAADACANACFFCQLDGYVGQTAGYTASPATGFCGMVQNDQWLGFIADADSIAIDVMPYNCQQDNGLEIALYADCLAPPIACTPGQAGGGDQVRSLTALLIPGQPYFLMINGFTGDACNFHISTSPAGAVFNMQLDSIGLIKGPRVVVEQSTQVYALDSVPYATSYRWTGPASVKINGQTPPVELAAPAGRQVTVTFGNESAVLGVQAQNACSQSLVSEQRIYIGTAPLASPCSASDLPAADNCGDACIFCNFMGYTGTTVGYSADPAPGFCGAVENNQWIGFVAGTTGATFKISASNCTNGDGLQAAVYQNCSEPPLVCAAGMAGGAADTLVLTALLEPYQQYFLMIDGYLGDQCDFSVAVGPPMAGLPPAMGITGPITGPATLCPGATVTYSVAPVVGAAGYTWQVPVGWLVNGMPGTYTGVGVGSNQVTVTANANGGQIFVTPFNACKDGTTSVKNLVSQPIPPTMLPTVTICAEDAPYVLPWGDVCTTSAIHCVTFSSYLGCDSVVCQQVIIRNPIVFFKAPQAICAGDSVLVCGEAFKTAGNFSKICTSYTGCDSTVNFIIFLLEPIAEIIPESDPLCSSLPVVLNSAASAGTKSWKRLDGTVLASGNLLTVPESGTYILMVTVSANGKICVATDSITIVEGAPPSAAATGGVLTCSQPSIQLSGSSSTAGVLFAWSGPDGFSSTEMAPTVTAPGLYILTVTDPQTGCTATATAEVLEDKSAPPVPVFNDILLNCINPVAQLLCLGPISNCQWSGPGIGNPNDPEPVVEVPGTYQLQVTGPNGCTATTEFQVLADFQEPVITAYIDPITCTDPGGTQHCSVDIPGSICTWEDLGLGQAFLVTATAPNGCTSSDTVTVQVDTSIPTVEVADDTLRCDQPTVALSCTTDIQNALFAWTGPGNFSSDLQNPTVMMEGPYMVTVTNPVNGCAAVATATVYSDAQLPQIILTPPPGPLTCSNPTVALQVVSMPSQVTFMWQGPNGFMSDSANLTVSEPGVYTVTAVSGINGCSSVASFIIGQDTTSPGAMAVGGVLSCAHPQVQLTGTSQAAIFTMAWSGPGIDFPPPGFNPVAELPGVYTLVVTAPNGCTSVDTALVLADTSTVLITLQSDTLTCATDSILIELPQLPGFPPTWITTPGAYSFALPNTILGCETKVEIAVVEDVQTPEISLVQLVSDQNGQGLGAIDVSIAFSGAYTVDWYLDNVLFSTAEDLDSLFAGVYTLLATGTANGCTSTLDVTVTDTLVATSVISAEAFWNIFPNPASDFLHLQYRGPGNPAAQVWLLDVAGRSVLEQNGIAGPDWGISCTQVSSGTYTILIKTATGAFRKQLTVLH